MSSVPLHGRVLVSRVPAVGADGLTTTLMVKVVDAPTAIVPSEHVTVPETFVQAVPSEDDVKVLLAPSVSVNTTFVATFGPAFWTDIVYVRMPPCGTPPTGSESVFVTEMSAWACAPPIANCDSSTSANRPALEMVPAPVWP